MITPSTAAWGDCGDAYTAGWNDCLAQISSFFYPFRLADGSWGFSTVPPEGAFVSGVGTLLLLDSQTSGKYITRPANSETLLITDSL